jgi:hypothetical protein
MGGNIITPRNLKYTKVHSVIGSKSYEHSSKASTNPYINSYIPILIDSSNVMVLMILFYLCKK